MGYSRTMFTRRKKPSLLRRRALLLLALIFCLWLMGFLRMILVPNYNIFLSSWWMWTLTSWKQGSCTPIRRFRYEPSVSKYDPFVAVSVISGSETRHRQGYQRATWADPEGGFFSFHNVSFFDENDVVKMPMGMSCQEAALKCDRKHPPRKDELWHHAAVFTGSSPGWWCFQSRGLIVLDHQLRKYPHAAWYFLVNDDTYVNVPALRKKAQSYSATSSACALGRVGHLQLPYYGDAFWTPIIWDGAGILINRKAADQLLYKGRKPHSLSVIEQCIDNTRKLEKWCWWHSDWVLSGCLQSAKIGVTEDKSFIQFPAEKLGKAGFYMGERDMENSTKEADWIANYCTKQTTCHKRKTLQSMLNIHNALKKQHIIN